MVKHSLSSISFSGVWESGSLGVWEFGSLELGGRSLDISPFARQGCSHSSIALPRHCFPSPLLSPPCDSDLWFPTFRRLRVAFDFSFPALRQRPLVPFGRRFSIRDSDRWFYIARYWQMAHFVTSLLSVSPKGFKDAGFRGQR